MITCHNLCHYQPSWHCYIPCCDHCQLKYPEHEYTIAALERHIADLKGFYVHPRFQPILDGDIARLEQALAKLNENNTPSA